MIQSEETIQTLAGPMKTWRVQLTIHEGKRKRKLTVWVGREEERPVWRAELKSTKGTMVMGTGPTRSRKRSYLPTLNDRFGIDDSLLRQKACSRTRPIASLRSALPSGRKPKMSPVSA